MQLDDLKWDAAGLVTVVVQDRHRGDVRMVAHANREAVEATLRSREAHFFSRSRGRLWKKGESSGNVQRVAEVWRDCDGDALLYLVDPEGPSCHTGTRSCFFTRLDEQGADDTHGDPTWVRFEDTLQARREATAGKSYTRSLLEKGATVIGGKITDEAGELARAVEAETDDRVDSEAADLVYHLVVGLMLRGRTLRDVLTVLAARFGTSGHVEKASRAKP